MSAGLAIQQTVYEILTADVPLTSKISKVYDGFPDLSKEAVKFPFISIGDTNSNPFVQFEHMGEEIFMTIHIWSRYKGYKEGQQIVGDVQRLLAQQELTVDGFGAVSSYFDSSDTMRDEDGITRHLMVRYRFQIQY